MKRLTALIFLIFLTACQSASKSTPEALRCPASQQLCLDLLRTYGKIEEINTRVPKEINVSVLSRKIAQNLRKMEIPFTMRREQVADQNIHEATFEYMVIELSFTQFVEAYQTFPGGSELITILSDSSMASGHELKRRIDEWAKSFLPGYRIEWPTETSSSFIEEVHFFNKLSNKVIPIGNHHDVLAHLFLILDPTIRSLTERISKVYEQALKLPSKKDSEALTELINYMWVRLQEHTPIEYRDRENRRRLAIIGGFPSLAVPFESLKGHILNDVYFKYDFWNQILKVGLYVEQRGDKKALFEFKDVTTFLRDITDAPDTIHMDMLSYHFSQISRVLDLQFLEVAEKNPSYQKAWLELSNRVFEAKGHPAHAVLLPENHRHLMDRIIYLLESYFSLH